jgi:hypothetical protein
MSETIIDTKCPECGAGLWNYSDGLLCPNGHGGIKPHYFFSSEDIKKLDVYHEGEAIFCKTCEGKGRIRCEECDGTGDFDCPECGSLTECTECDGVGDCECDECEGLGYIIEGEQ